jgi:hypothetical protein
MTPALLVVVMAGLRRGHPCVCSWQSQDVDAGHEGRHDVLEPSNANDVFRFEFQTATQYQIGLRDVAS